MRRVVKVGPSQKCRIELHPIQLEWGKKTKGAVFTNLVLCFPFLADRAALQEDEEPLHMTAAGIG